VIALSTMDLATRVFWLTVTLLLGAAVFFGLEARQHEGARVLREAALDSGDVVRISTVLDGDTVVVLKDEAGRATVRLLGIKSFEAKQAKDEQALRGRLAADALRTRFQGEVLRVLTHAPPRDRQGRTLASLYAGPEDIALWMVSEGHVMVYTVYPFAQMTSYLAAQNEARNQRKGLWASAALREQAAQLERDWGR
jgi:endonuclease YncB( thermonuclease family)